MKPPVISRPALAACLLLAASSTTWTAWGQDDDDYTVTTSENEHRTLNGTGNNKVHSTWGSAGQTQVRSVTVASYSDGVSEPSGDLRPSPREVLSEVFLETPPSSAATSALFIGWGLLVGYDLFLNGDNASDPFDMECNNVTLADVWCPEGSLSDPIPFHRSQGELDTEGDGTRSPTNFATAFVDLDWIYGRDEDSATALRTSESGYLNLTAAELPHLLPDGTWLVADQRPTTMPVTFALMTLLMREHNRCCDEWAGDWGADGDEEAYQACRQWTIAVFQHITENDFSVRLIGASVKTLGADSYDKFYDDDNDVVNGRRRRRRLDTLTNDSQSRRLARTQGTYDNETNAGVDAVFSTVAIPAFFSALPSTVGLRDDDYSVMDEHGIELAMASADMAGLIERIGGIDPIIRGAAYSRTQAIDVSFNAEISTSSPLFNLPAETIQRGRDHGIPSYNDVLEGYGFERATTYADVSSNETVQELLAAAYGDDVDLLDAYTGALAESETGLPVGPLLQNIFLEQLYRGIVGDRHHHSHDTQNEDAELSTLRALVLNNSDVSNIALDTFTAPDLVALTTLSTPENEVTLAEGYKVAWGELVDGTMNITISARGIGTQGMIAIGFGGGGMTTTRDFVICEVLSDSTANCTDHGETVDGRNPPPIDTEDGNTCALAVQFVLYDGEWTSVTFTRCGSGNDASDYPLTDDIEDETDTKIVYSWRSGPGKTERHPNSQRGSALVNFKSGISSCDDTSEYFALHGALLLFAWMVIAPYGIYQARYRKGKTTLLGNLWWEMHQECMVVCAEALLPLAITAIFTTGGPHNSSHAKWGFYMMGAVSLQLITGYARSKALEGKGSNFSLFHRVNKHCHIYAGWFAYIAGLVQCYRGLELVSGAEKLVFSAVDINFTLGNFDIARNLLFPIWIGIVPVFFLYLEVRKQFDRYFTKGAANLCGMVEIINEEFSDEALKKEVEDRLMPRTEELPLYSTHEFNDKILNGRAWVIVDGAVLDVSSFAKRHPGGARLIMNAMGTDVTSEIMGEEASIGNSNMAFAPHPHTDTALEIARSLVVGYIEEDDDMESENSDEDESSSDLDLSGKFPAWFRRLPSLSGSDNERNESRATTRNSYRSPRASRVPSGGQQSARTGRLAPWPGHTSSGDEADATRKKSHERGRGSVSPTRGMLGDAGGSGSDTADISERARSSGLDSSNGSEQKRRHSGVPVMTQNRWKTAAAAVIKRANSNPLRMKSFGNDVVSDEEEGKKSSTHDIKKGAQTGSTAAVGAGMKLSAEAAAIANADSPEPKTPPLGMSNAAGVVAPPLGSASPAPFSSVSGRRWPERSSSGHQPERSPTRSPSSRSKSFAKPVALDHPVTVSAPPAEAKPTATGKKPKINPVRRMLSRMGSQMDPAGGASGDESESKQEPRSFKATRRVWEKKNPLDFFHVCPLLLHEKMGGSSGRPVHKFVFTCPGKAAALVNAMNGVCHFNMRVAQEAGMSVVQRSYNAFAVRVQGQEGVDRRVVPAGETGEGELCIEMRIRLYSDGLMSSQLSRLIKNFDNPAVQLQGPFLQDRLIPPPTHRNVVMIAAGTGVNPMVQMIRDYFKPRSRADGVLVGAHSRLVLLWQNSVEEDLFCADELTTLQAKAKGLLEVIALISGDTTRRNVPGNAFRRAKARLLKKGREAGLISRDSGQQKDVENDKDDISGRKPFKDLGLSRALSRVTEEDCMSRDSSFVVRNMNGFDSRDLEIGGSGGRDNFRNGMVAPEGVQGALEVIGGSGNDDMPWSSRHGDRNRGNAGDIERGPKASTGRRAERSRSPRGQRATGGSGRAGEAREPSATARSTDPSTSVRRNGQGLGNGGASGRSGQKKGSSGIISYEEACKRLNEDSSDGSGRLPERARAGPNETGPDRNGDDALDISLGGHRRGPSRGGGGTRSSIRLADTLNEAKLRRDRWSRSVGKEDETDLPVEGGVEVGKVKMAKVEITKVTKSNQNSRVGLSRSPRIGVVNDSSGEEKVDIAAVPTSSGLLGSRSHRRTAPKLPPDGSELSSSARLGVGVKDHSNAKAKRTKTGSSRGRSSARSRASDTGSQLDDSGSGLQHAKISTALVKKAIGAEVMRAIASAKAAAVSGASMDGSGSASVASRSAFNDLVGTETTGGILQVVVSGPAGFVFRAEGILAELGIPPQAVVLLD